MSETHGTTDLAAAETEVRRWLGELVDDTATDPRAWETIQDRIAAARPAGHRPTRSRPRLAAVALAAAIVLVVVAAVVAGRHPGGGQVDTSDDDVTTTDPDQPTRADADRTTTPTTASTPPADLPPGSRGQGDAAGGAGGAGDAVAPDTGSPGATAPAGGTQTPDTDPTTTTPAPPRQTPALTFETSDYTLEAFFSGGVGGRVDVDYRRAGTAAPEMAESPGEYGWSFGYSWGMNDAPPPDGECVTFGVMNTAGLYLAPHIFVPGLVGPGVSTVDVVMADGGRVRALIGARAPDHDVRAWLAEVAGTDVDRVEGFDAAGNLVLSSPWSPDTGAEAALRC